MALSDAEALKMDRSAAADVLCGCDFCILTTVQTDGFDRCPRFLRKLSEALMDRIHGSYRFIVAFNLSLITLGVAGVLPPAISALLHNTSTLGIGLKNMTDLLEDENTQKRNAR